MQSIVSLLLTGALAFAATNTDDLLMMTCFLSATNSPFEKRCVVIGQYLGFIALLALSAGGSFGASEVSGKWIGLLGIYPICKGIGELRKRFLSRGVSVKKPWGYRRPTPF